MLICRVGVACRLNFMGGCFVKFFLAGCGWVWMGVGGGVSVHSFICLRCCSVCHIFFFFKQKTAYEILA